MSYSREQLEKWVKKIDITDKKVLDIGGGQLPVLGRAKGEPKEYKILDLKKPHQKNATIDIEIDLNSLYCGVYMIDYKNSFDTVFCLEVMEYIYNPVQAIENIRYFLKENGTLYISFHFLYPIHNPKEQDYLRYTEWGVKKLLTELDFEIIDFKYKGLKCFNSYNMMNNFEGNKGSKDYEHHNASGYLIKCKKIL